MTNKSNKCKVGAIDKDMLEYIAKLQKKIDENISSGKSCSGNNAKISFSAKSNDTNNKKIAEEKHRKVQYSNDLHLFQLKEVEENEEHLRNEFKIMRSAVEKMHKVIGTNQNEIESTEQ